MGRNISYFGASVFLAALTVGGFFGGRAIGRDVENGGYNARVAEVNRKYGGTNQYEKKLTEVRGPGDGFGLGLGAAGVLGFSGIIALIKSRDKDGSYSMSRVGIC